MLAKMRRAQTRPGRSRRRIALWITGAALAGILAIHLAIGGWWRPSVDLPGEWRGVEFARLLDGRSGGLPEQCSYLLYRVPGGWRLFHPFPNQDGESGERFLPEDEAGPWPADLAEATRDVPFGLARWCPVLDARSRDSRPNEVLLVKVDDLWVDLIGARPRGGAVGPDLYIGGIDADGDLRTIPFRLGYPIGAFQMGGNVTPLDWFSTFGRETCCQIRVVRRAEEIIYVWAGHWHDPYPPEDAVTVRVPVCSVRAEAWRDQLAGFRRKLDSLPTGRLGRRTVFLDVGDNV
jgi:hypothetical protein